jgi:hypothetical protein
MPAAVVLILALTQSPDGVDFFEQRIRPLLVERCAECHAEGAKKIKGGFRVDTRDGLRRGGETGAAAVVPGKPEQSLLLKALRWTDEELRMPPKAPLPKEQIDAVEAWIRMGAPDPRTATAAHPVGLSIDEGRTFWSFKAPAEPPAGWTIDSLVGAALKAKGLEAAPEADPRTLLRRLTYDLTGLPPTAEELDGFTTADTEKAVDRLLASPRFGERWGRHWLDVVRYADTKEWVVDEERRLPYPWTYRDWVIRAFNEDLPFDRFVKLQLAADKLVKEGDSKADLAALGFLTVGRSFLNRQPDIIDDQIDVLTRGLLGLTVQCARCHDHKYDPIPTKDYYSLYGIFASSAKAKEMPLIGEPAKSAEYDGFVKELAVREGVITKFREQRRDAMVAELRKPERIADYLLACAELAGKDDKEARSFAERKKINSGILKRWRERMTASDPVFSLWAAYAGLPADDFAVRAAGLSLPGLHPLVRETFAEAPASLREAAERYASLLASAPLADVHKSMTEMPLAEVDQFLSGDERGKMRQMKRKVDEMAHFPGAPPRAMTVEDTATPHQPKVFIRGNSGSTGEEVPRAFLSVLSPPERAAYQTGGRLELAEAVVARDNPLAARVWVNRAWQRLFGAGLVRTPSDFGTRGEPPTHPELLDGLALRFHEDGGSTKKLIKRIVMSAAYRRSSAAPLSPLDPENRLLARQNRRRLDLEATRDSLLAASGRLDLAMGGRSVVLETAPFSSRRTVYGWIDRLNLATLYKTFDFALPDMHSPQRHVTTVPLQALFLMNSPFVLEQARHLAARVPCHDIDALYRAVFGRLPTDLERKLGLEFLERAAAAPPPAPAVAWQYGTARWRGLEVADFAPLPHFTGTAWQGGAKLPDARIGWALLNAVGGHAADKPGHLVVRRWTAPRAGTLLIDGRLRHDAKGGDGVLGRLVSSRAGLLAEWISCRDDVETGFEVEVAAGEILDFAVECRADNNADSFQWAPALALGEERWSATSGFSGPGEKQPSPLTGWEKYAQVLLETNEFVFLD